MSDLNLGPAEERSPLRSIAVAVVVLGIVAVAVLFLNPRKTAEISVTSVQIFAPHTESKPLPGASKVIGTHIAAEDNLYVVATVHITDKLRLPLFLSIPTANLIAQDGSSSDATVVSPRDFARLEETFPALAPMLTQPLLDGDEIAPGASRDGKVLMLFPGMNEAAWNSKKSAALTFNLMHQSPQTVFLP